MNGKRVIRAAQRSRQRRTTFGVRAGPCPESVRGWLKTLPVCPALEQHQILHVGVTRARSAIDFTRTQAQQRRDSPESFRGYSQTSCFVACLSGQGRLRVDGRWYPCPAGTAYLVPGRAMDVVPATSGKAWEFCWVCRLESRTVSGLGTAHPTIEMAWFDPLPLRYAIEGLACECKADAVPKDIQHWADLIHSYVMRIARRGPEYQPLAALWERVSADLDADWSLARLAREAGYSCGHLGRLCRRALGRSPMHQVTWLRMRRAAEMVATTNLTLEAVAQKVGYANPFVFSNAFTRWVGCRPSDYRRRSNKQF